MLVSNRGLLEEMNYGSIKIDPFLPELVQPASYDVTLGPSFKLQLKIDDAEGVAFDIDPSVNNDDYFIDVDVPKGAAFALEPGAFALASTFETITLGANIASRLEGKSSLGRLGLIVHTTAGFIDPGFDGQITLELSNSGTMPILLWPGMKIAQLCFYHLPEPTTLLYGSRLAGSHYQNQHGPTTSKSYQNFKIYDVYGTDNAGKGK